MAEDGKSSEVSKFDQKSNIPRRQTKFADGYFKDTIFGTKTHHYRISLFFITNDYFELSMQFFQFKPLIHSKFDK